VCRLIATWKVITKIKIRNSSNKRILNMIIRIPTFTEDYHQKVLSLKCDNRCRVRKKSEMNNMAYILIREVKPSSIKTVNMESLIEVKALTFNLKKVYNPTFFTSLPQKYIVYTRPQQYWETEDEIIKSAVEKLIKETKEDTLKYIRAAFKFVNENIKLKSPMNVRLGAIKALKSYEGDCDELSDVFITLLRGRNIPARRVVGYFVKSKNNGTYELEPHAWSEVLLSDGIWVPFDPALGFFAMITERHIVRYKIGLTSSISMISARWKNVPSDKVSIEMEEEVEQYQQ